MNGLSYRADIDGLRAFAVLSVIFFHAGVPGFSGGFVGVDVFFVISGYLITALILKDLQAGTFTFSGFWERRARRILPALTVVVAVTLAAGWFIFLPDDYAALGKQAAAQAIFGSNILFYKEAGYFDSSSTLKPLLHTWSLAVEEQFYILFPLAILCVWKVRQWMVAPFLWLSAIVSFALCLFVMQLYPNLAFYMLPFRGWELLIGSLIALYHQKPDGMRPWLAETLSTVGILAIGASVFLYTDKTVFPGMAALLPCLGAAAIVFTGVHHKTTVSTLLSHRPVVFIGLVSYSWYLWHWPAIVFAKYHPALSWNGAMAAMCVAGSFVAAILSWKYIETPFRQRRFASRKTTMLFAAVFALMGLLIAGWTIMALRGVPERLDPVVASLAAGINDTNPHRKECDKRTPEQVAADDLCQTNPESGAPTFILWGDSQADAIAPAFYDLSKRHGRNGFIATHHGCEAILDFHKTTWEPASRCHDFNQAVFDLIRRHEIKHVFLVSHYGGWMSQNALNPSEVSFEGDVPEGYAIPLAAGMARTFDDLRDAGAQIYLLLDVPGVPFDPPRTLAMDKLSDPTALYRMGLSRQGYLSARQRQLDAFLDKYGRDKLVILDPADILCPEDFCMAAANDRALYYNSGHLSGYGAVQLGGLFEPFFK